MMIFARGGGGSHSGGHGRDSTDYYPLHHHHHDRYGYGIKYRVGFGYGFDYGPNQYFYTKQIKPYAKFGIGSYYGSRRVVEDPFSSTYYYRSW